MATTKPFREEEKPILQLTPGFSWSSWYTALVPKEPCNNPENYERRKGKNKGFIFQKIETRFLEKGYDDGIYELRFSRGKTHYVVYIGKSDSKSPNSINKRIREYCRDGSHISDEINRAMGNGYKMYVRAKNIPGSEDYVEECEKKYLAQYDYAWNDINNGRVRDNIPPP